MKKTFTIICAFIFMLSLSCIDSNNMLPFIGFIVSGIMLFMIAYKSGYTYFNK